MYISKPTKKTADSESNSAEQNHKHSQCDLVEN